MNSHENQKTVPSSDLKDSLPAGRQEECAFAQMYKAVTGTSIADRKDNEGKTVGQKCGKVRRPGTACKHCQETPSFTVPLEMTRELPRSAFNQFDKQQLRLRSFPIPSGERLLIFSSLDEAKQSPWKEQENPFKTGYVALNQHGAKVVQIQCCPHCHKAHLAAGEGVDPALFCNKLTKSETMTPETAALGPIKFIHPLRHGQPTPNCFVFGKDLLPLRIKLPDTVLIKADQEGKPIFNEFGDYQRYSEAEIVVCFDDIVMPFNLIEGIIHIEVNRHPFQRLDRPRERDDANIKIMVYLNNGKVPPFALDLRYDRPPITVLPPGSPDRPTVLYAVNFPFFISNVKRQEKIDADSGSDSDSENSLPPQGVSAKRRFRMAHHLRLNMGRENEEALYTLCQNYLHGQYLEDEKSYAQIRSDRNGSFTQTFGLAITPENRIRKIEWCNEMLNEVTSFYLRHNHQLPSFREGLLQLLIFSHGLRNKDNFISILSYVRNLRVRAIIKVLEEDKSTFQLVQTRVQALKETRLKQTPIDNPAQLKTLDWEINREVICQLLASDASVRNAVYQKLPTDVLRIPAERTCTFHFNRMVEERIELLVVTVTPDNQVKQIEYRNKEEWEAAARDEFLELCISAQPPGVRKEAPPPSGTEKKQEASAASTGQALQALGISPAQLNTDAKDMTREQQPVPPRPIDKKDEPVVAGPDKTLATERRKSL